MQEEGWREKPVVVAELLRIATTLNPKEVVIDEFFLFYFLVLTVPFLRLSILDFLLLILYFSYLTSCNLQSPIIYNSSCQKSFISYYCPLLLAYFAFFVFHFVFAAF
jgi:hypothetical protein